MNVIKAKIIELDQFEGLTLVKAESLSQLFSAIVVEDLTVHNEIHVGGLIQLCFKETEVSIGLPPIVISLRNQIAGVICQIDQGKLLSRITLDTKFGQINSLITTGSVERLNLSEGQEVIGLIKTNEMMIEIA